MQNADFQSEIIEDKGLSALDEGTSAVSSEILELINKNGKTYDQGMLKKQISLMQKWPDRSGREGKLHGMEYYEINSEDCSDGRFEVKNLGYDDGYNLPDLGRTLDRYDTMYKYDKLDSDNEENRKLVVYKLVGDFDKVDISHLCTNGVLDLSESQVKYLYINVDHTHSINILHSDNALNVHVSYSLEKYIRERINKSHEWNTSGYKAHRNMLIEESTGGNETTISNANSLYDGSPSDAEVVAVYYVASSASESSNDD